MMAPEETKDLVCGICGEVATLDAKRYMSNTCGEEGTLDDSLVVQKENVITGAKERCRHYKCNSL